MSLNFTVRFQNKDGKNHKRSGSCALEDIWKILHSQFHKILSTQPPLSNNNNTTSNKIKTWITLDETSDDGKYDQ